MGRAAKGQWTRVVELETGMLVVGAPCLWLGDAGEPLPPSEATCCFSLGGDVITLTALGLLCCGVLDCTGVGLVLL